MATPVFCCGFECGGPILSSGAGHLGNDNSATISTTTFRTGLRALRCNPSANIQGNGVIFSVGSNHFVARVYIRFATLPNATVELFYATVNSVNCGAYFNSADNKIYAGRAPGTLGATGVAVTTGVWYRIDVKVNASANPWTIDVQVDGTACGQVTNAVAADTYVQFFYGNVTTTCTADYFFDDCIVSQTASDYPLGAGYVLSYIPNADGTHNVAGAADFKHGTGTTPAGTDITNATTTAWQDIDKRPLVASAAGAETLINMIAPPNATDYVEIQFEDSVEASPPRAVEVIIGINQAGTGAGNMEVRLNDNGTMGTVYTATGVAGVAIATGVVFKRAHFADPPSAASAWVLGGAGNGDFNDLRIRFGSPAAVDANPDQYLIEAMFEAEYAEIFSATRKPVNINQAVARLSLR